MRIEGKIGGGLGEDRGKEIDGGKILATERTDKQTQGSEKHIIIEIESDA